MTSLPTLVATDADVTTSISTILRHRCPFVDEADDGNVNISWRCNGRTFELHSLAGWLEQWTDSEISHEQITDTIAHVISAFNGIEDVKVITRWTTAGMTVTVTGGTGALPGEPIHAKGA